MIPLSEGQISTGIKDYLETLQAMGKLLYFRMNAGTFLTGGKDGQSCRVVRGCKAGTSDFLVIAPENVALNRFFSVIFIEAKKSDWNPNKKKTKTELAQEEFRKLVESQGHLYKIVRSVDEAITLLDG